jgi:hypothetical protein
LWGRELKKKQEALLTNFLDATTAEQEDGMDPVHVLDMIRLELTDDKIDLFIGIVEDIYKKSFELQYKGFTVVNDYLVERRDIKVMYQTFINTFPFVHSVLTLTVSHLRYNAVKLSVQMSLGEDAASDVVGDGYNASEDNNELTKHQQALLEFFIAKLRLWSQKNMGHWAMLLPLSCHSHGLVAAAPFHPLRGTGCSCAVLWRMLNDLYDRMVSAQLDTVCQQYTVSMAFDNWQQMLKKTWQTNGCSGNYLKSVASFIKKDKAVMIPIGSVLRSQLGVIFKTTLFCFLDAYLTVVGGELMTNIYPLPLVNDKFAMEEINNLDKAQRIVEQEVVHVMTGTLLMPLVCWDVMHLAGQALTPHMSYIDFPNPPPIHACVEKDISMDILFFGK